MLFYPYIYVFRFEKAAGMGRHKITREYTMTMEDSVSNRLLFFRILLNYQFNQNYLDIKYGIK